MGILNTIVCKLNGFPTVSELVDRDLGAFMGKHGLDNYKVDMYKVDRDSSDPRFWERVYVGTAFKEKEQVGILITYSEGCGLARGYFVQKSKISQQKKFVSDYKASPKYATSSLAFHLLNELGEISEIK